MGDIPPPGKTQEDKQLRLWLQQLRESDLEIRREASKALGMVKTLALLPIMIERIPSATGQELRFILSKLEEFGPRAASAATSLCQRYESLSSKFRKRVLRTFKAFGEEASTDILQFASGEISAKTQRKLLYMLTEAYPARALAHFFTLYCSKNDSQRNFAKVQMLEMGCPGILENKKQEWFVSEGKGEILEEFAEHFAQELQAKGTPNTHKIWCFQWLSAIGPPYQLSELLALLPPRKSNNSIRRQVLYIFGRMLQKLKLDEQGFVLIRELLTYQKSQGIHEAILVLMREWPESPIKKMAFDYLSQHRPDWQTLPERPLVYYHYY